MLTVSLLLSLLGAEPRQPFSIPRDPAPQYGHGLTAREAMDGWISLFDGKTDFGWKDARVSDGLLHGGVTTVRFGDCSLKAEVAAAGTLAVGDRRMQVAAGPFQCEVRGHGAGPIRLGPGTVVRTLAICPLAVRPLFNGQDLTGWKIVPHPQLAADRQAKWMVEGGAIRTVGGPGALEHEELYGDFVLQATIRTRAPLTNGGVFFRAKPGEFLRGYEAQIFNACYDGDPDKPARYSTGAIDDRQVARRLVSRDGEPFLMTVVAVGPQLATWVNGDQLIDWTDTRPPSENSREGLRLAAGAIQLQAHDPQTDLEFRDLRAGRVE